MIRLSLLADASKLLDRLTMERMPAPLGVPIRSQQ